VGSLIDRLGVRTFGVKGRNPYVRKPFADRGRVSKKQEMRVSSHERIWGKLVLSHGYTAVPSILIQAQRRLGVTPLQFNIIAQLLDYWRNPERAPFPSKADLATRIGVKPKTIQANIRALEKAGLVEREMRRAAAGDWNSNVYHLAKLVERVQKLEPEFAQAREKRREARDAQKRAETPLHRRRPGA
jgi:DNA-binding MarR family transcriptional regulator